MKAFCLEVSTIAGGCVFLSPHDPGDAWAISLNSSSLIAVKTLRRSSINLASQPVFGRFFIAASILLSLSMALSLGFITSKSLFRAGIRSFPIVWTRPLKFPFSLVMLSLNWSAAAAPSVVKVMPSFLASSVIFLMPSPPSLSRGIRSVPDLPNICMARAVFPAPSSMVLNLSESFRNTSSVDFSLPVESVTLMPRALNASLASPVPFLVSAMFRPRNLRPVATPSREDPESSAACLRPDRDSTAIPVRLLISCSSSPALAVFCARP